MMASMGNRAKFQVMLATGAAALALMPLAAAAQGVPSGSAADSGQSYTDASGDIIVTATKRRERLADIPMGISTISGDALERRNVRSFEDLAPLVPGLAIQGSGPVVTRLILRGLNAGGAGSTVAVYVDDSPVGSSNALLQGAILTSNADTFDMARIEVLKGPQGTLYGANSEGGLLKYVTNAPDLSTFSARVQGEVNTVQKGGIGYAARGVVNVPLATDMAAVRVGGFYEKLAGYIDDTARGVKDANNGQRYGARVSALVKLGTAANLRLTAFHQYLKSNASPSVDVVGSPNTYAQPGTNIFDPFQGDLQQRRYIATFRSNQFTNASATLDWDLGPATLTAITSYSRAINREIGDPGSLTAFYSAPVSAAAPFGVPVSYNAALGPFYFPGQTVYGRSRNYFSLKKVTQEIRLSSRPNDFLEWQVGGFFTHETSFSVQATDLLDAGANFAVINTPPGPGGDYLIDARYREFAGFGDATLKLSPQIEVNFGARYATSKQRSLATVTNGLIGIPVGLPIYQIALGFKEDAFTYSVAPKFKINENTLLYARYATGFRPGGPNLVPPGAPADYPTAYKSDRTRNYEIGFRSVGPNQLFSLDIAAFRIDWTDIQIVTPFATSVGTISVTGNGGKARSQGFEFAFGLKPVKGLSFNLTGAYTDAKLTSAAPGIGGLRGDKLAYVPDLTGTFDAEYRAGLGEGVQGYFGLTLSYIGKRYTDFGTSIFFTPHIPLPDYGTLGLRAGVDLHHVQLEVFARNVTDTRGILGYANAGVGNPTITGSKTIIQPRTIGLMATAHF